MSFVDRQWTSTTSLEIIVHVFLHFKKCPCVFKYARLYSCHMHHLFFIPGVCSCSHFGALTWLGRDGSSPSSLLTLLVFIHPKYFSFLFFFFILDTLFCPCQMSVNSPELLCLLLRPSNSGACFHGDASGSWKACSDDLQSAASPPLPCVALRVASL